MQSIGLNKKQWDLEFNAFETIFLTLFRREKRADIIESKYNELLIFLKREPFKGAFRN
jgi:hypothetical protein